MDVDVPEEIERSSSSSNVNTRYIIALAPVDDAHPLELDGYIANYTGRAAVDRLIHTIRVCPQVAPQAFQLAIQQLRQLRDHSLYQMLLSAYEHSQSLPDVNLPPPASVAVLDPKWIDKTTSKNLAERTKLETELKTYTNNMIKESIRMAHRDLGDFYRSTGDHSAALKHYTKSREYCTTSQHILDMCLSVLELLIEQRNYSHISTYVFKADAALEAATATSSNGNDKGTVPVPVPVPVAAPAAPKKSAEREKVQSKLDLATALSHLGLGQYEKAANSFLNLGPPNQLGDWIGKIIATGDIAIYGTLCALASLPRSTIKTLILQNVIFSTYVEHEPYVRELVEAYMSSNFRTALDILSQYSTRHYVDVYLAPHVHDLTNLIRNSFIVLYFQPFATIKLERMSQAFGWTVEEVERHVVALIQSGHIKGRVDSQNKILQAKKTDYRADLFTRAIRAGTDMKNMNRKLLLRLRLQQAELTVKSPKSGHHAVTSMHLSELLQGD